MSTRINTSLLLMLLFGFCNSFAKEKKVQDLRVYNASLWIDSIKMPITSGKAIWIDSLFVIFKANKELSMNDVHSNVVLQLHDSKSLGTRAVVVDYDLQTGWFLAEIKRQSVSTPRQKLGEQQIVDIAYQNSLIDFKEKKATMSALQKFEQGRHNRGLAGEKNFYEMLGVQIKEYSSKMTNALVKSQRKIFWKDNISMPLPLVDSCEVDSNLLIKLKNHAQLKLEQAFKCRVQSMSSSRDVASALKPEYEVMTGVLKTNEAFLKVPSVSAQLSLLSNQFDEDVTAGMALGRCTSRWIGEKQLYIKSCVTKNGTFSDIYNGFHLLGFYHNQKIIYKLMKTHGFSKDNQIDIVEKMLNTTRGSVL